MLSKNQIILIILICCFVTQTTYASDICIEGEKEIKKLAENVNNERIRNPNGYDLIRNINLLFDTYLVQKECLISKEIYNKILIFKSDYGISENAIELVEQMESRNYLDETSYVYAVSLLANTGKSSEAERLLTKSLPIVSRSKNPNLLLTYCTTLESLEKYTLGVKVCSEYINKFEENLPIAYYVKARSLFCSGKIAEANHDYNISQDLGYDWEPHYGEQHYGIKAKKCHPW